jgi:hypothetical protein
VFERVSVGDVHHGGVQALGSGALDARRVDVAHVDVGPLRGDGRATVRPKPPAAAVMATR